MDHDPDIDVGAPAEQLTVPEVIPLLPLMNTVIFPQMVAPLLVLRQR